MAEKIIFYDTTLRDGAQREGVSLSVEDKLRIAHCLDELGVDYIEGGFIGSNPKDAELFAAFEGAEHQLKQAKLVAFGLPARKGIAAINDSTLRLLAQSQAEVITLVGKASERQVEQALETTLDENLRMIYGSVAYLVRNGKRVMFDAEHYFDGYKSNAAYVFEVLAAAIEGGAEAIVLCDTNGGCLPNEVYEITRQTIDALMAGNLDVAVGIHAHDDSGCAVANSLEAVRAGATMIQGTVNGYGERVGNCNLLTAIANIELKTGLTAIAPDKLQLLTSTSQFVAEVFNVTLDAHAPYVGKSAFVHKGGLHVSAETRFDGAYEHIDPALVGNFTHIVLSDLAGRAALGAKALEFGINLQERTTVQNGQLLHLIKTREAQGYSYEVADASLALLMHSEVSQRPQYFQLESFRVISEKREDGQVVTEATIKIHVGDERFIATAEGNGPVNALDTALRKAITRFYPQIRDLELCDFKVRVLDESVGTNAVTRVFIETTDGENSWGTVGVSENIIEASWDALVDSITYGLFRGAK